MKRIFSLFASALLAISAWAVELQVSYEYVDLGLSVKWATCNLGATSSTAAGWYLAWGETSPKTNYEWDTYLSGLGGTMTSLEDAGTEKDPLKEYVKGGANYSEGIGATAYDAATAALGAGYRMPTQTEFAELANTSNCTWEWYAKDNTEFNGVAGYKVTSKKAGYTGNSIFLPAAGYRDGEYLGYEGLYGFYWSSTPSPDTANPAYYLYFNSDDVRPNRSYYDRYYGFPVRPVYDGPDPIAQITTDEGTTKYTDVDEFMTAFDAITSKTTVTLLGDITLPEGSSTYNNKTGADITLDLNGHNITGNNAGYDAIYIYGQLTIEGEGIVENIGGDGDAVGSEGTVVINSGTYKGIYAAVYVDNGSKMIINGGKFNAPDLYYINYDKPIVKGGIFSMDPSDCVAEGYVSVANDDEATKAEYQYKVVDVQTAYDNLASLIGENVYAYYIDRISVDEDGVILINDDDLTPEKLVVNGNEYLLGDLKFVVADGAIAHVYEMDEDEILYEYGVVVPESELVALVGDNVYVLKMSEGDVNYYSSIYVEEGQMICDDDPMSTVLMTVATKLGDNYVYGSKDYDLVFVVEDGEVVRVDMGTSGEIWWSFLKKDTTPTAIDAVNAEKSGKAFKTIENGKVVIIRNGEKFDLTGRKL